MSKVAQNINKFLTETEDSENMREFSPQQISYMRKATSLVSSGKAKSVEDVEDALGVGVIDKAVLRDTLFEHFNESDPDPDFHEADLAELISGCLFDTEDMNIDVTSFADAGVMTRNVGLVVTVGDHQFQITIIKSK